MNLEFEEQSNRRERLLRYLLDEVDAEEKFEIEKLCNLEEEWKREKRTLSQCLALIEEAGADGFELDLPEIESLQFSPGEKEEIANLLNESPESSQTPQGKVDPKNKNLQYWIPLMVAAAASVVAYFGTMETTTGPSERLEEEKLLVALDPNMGDRQAVSEAASSSNDEFGSDSSESPQGKAVIAFQGQGSELAAKSASGSEARTDFDIEGKRMTSISALLRDDPNLTAEASVEAGKAVPALGLRQAQAAPYSKSKLDAADLFAPKNIGYLHQLDGDSLGRILLLGNHGKSIFFRRMDWVDPEKSFALGVGDYQMRIDRGNDFVVLLEGSVRKSVDQNFPETGGETQNYQFIVRKTWKLAENEKRRPIEITFPPLD